MYVVRWNMHSNETGHTFVLVCANGRVLDQGLWCDEDGEAVYVPIPSVLSLRDAFDPSGRTQTIARSSALEGSPTCMHAHYGSWSGLPQPRLGRT